MSNETIYVSGDWNIICDVCGFKLKASKSRQRWDGLVVCQADWESRHPMDFIKTPTDKISVPFTRPRPTDIYVKVCDLWSSSPMADYAEAGCATVGGNTNIDLAWIAFHTPAIAGVAVASRTITGRKTQ